ncbi:MAG: hypothetical protein GPJ52_02685 [Candidatus Heimdallarchaeota archaeon]|jgi:hypothetical protein|nr:hypothetical protein [Candidatus Heimdallarchaeota archaeon]NPE07319.1 hypothetical protein [Asgard group archaeon]MCG3253397.1 hypothetical protein [Candidatus Heimdallarchaeota archaeon]MCK4290534.1 hypothetical protein [Candidatus Heimdallarchaeota archaeon]MCK5046555.1 hypothetical protein [Candidatus Heimdallarchaeota archaeon]
MTTEVTVAKMCKLEVGQPIQLPQTFLDALKPEEGNYAVMILAPSTKIIRIIPTTSEKVYKVGIEIGKLSPDFLKKMGSLFMKAGIKTLYSTGLCFTQESCVYEGYIDSKEFKNVNMETIKEELADIDGVSKVDISVLEIP